MNIKQKIGAALAIGALSASVLTPMSAFAADVTIQDNGTGSTNHAAVIKVSKSKLKQKNTTVVGTHVTNIQNTGANKANGNTGGSQSITTGNNTATTTVTVNGGTNTNSDENCCCDGEPASNTITIIGNGSESNNGALIVDVCKQKVSQKNTTVVLTGVTNVQNTGGNEVKNNTGDGSTNDIDTGNNTATTTVTVTGSTNTN